GRQLPAWQTQRRSAPISNTMTHHDAFLQDILARPDDDAPRLIYADWLEDNGDPQRAQFIRLQIELANLPMKDPQRKTLEERERTLLDRHGSAWRAATAIPAKFTLAEFTRGFVEAVAAPSAEAFVRSAEQLFAAAPIRVVRIWM